MQPQSRNPQERRKSLANHEIVTMALTLCGVAACICWIMLLCPLALGQTAADSPDAAPRPLITQPVDESQRTTLSGNTYPLARPEFDVGTAPARLPMERMLLVLKRSPEKEFALRTLLDDQQDKGSPNYHQWLTPEQVGTQFGPTDADMQTITAWLQSHGFEVGSTKGRTVLEFSGSASQVQEAFHTTIHEYIVNGEQHWANARDPSIPAALAPAVAGIDSLHNFPRKATNRYVGQYSVKTHRLTSPADPAYTVACGNGSECYFLTPYDFATIYDVQTLWTSSIDGTGQTIGIVGRTDVNPQDATNFWQLFGLTTPANKLNIIYNGYPPEVNGDEPEADIDIQWSGSVAPQATIDFVTSESTETTDGVDLSAVYIVDNNLAPVMSESYGECELGLGTAGNQFYYALWEQAAAQGISVFVSSGDNGSAACDNPAGPAQYGLNVNGIASTPFNAAIGGTDFNQYETWSNYWNPTNNPSTEESAKGYIPETTWNDSCTNSLAITLGYGSTAEQACNNQQMIQDGGVNSTGDSGGPSNCAVNTQGVLGSCTQSYPKPSWQIGTGVPADNKRDLPDVSLFASNGFLGSAYVICEQDVTGGCSLNDLLGYGGTSVASPAFAGILSLVNEKMGGPQGVPGFALYQLASKQANAFHDVPSGSTIAMPCVTGTQNCVTNTAGDAYGVLSGYSTNTAYDLATGLGSVDAANLVNNWRKASFTATTTTLSLNSGNAVNITHGTAVPVSIAVSATAASGAASLLVSNQAGTTIGPPIDGFTLTNGATAATAATSRLPGGSNYYVIAHYGGDGIYGGSYSTPMAVTVNPEKSQPDIFLVTFDGNGNVVNGHANAAEYGTQYLLRVNVENAAAQACSPFGAANTTACPSGTVNLTNNGSSLDSGTYTLNDYGYVEDRTVQLPGGTDSVAAAYSGDNSFNASTATAPITITPANTQLAITGIQGAVIGQSATISAIVVPYSAFGAAPSGTVTFYGNGTALSGTVTYSTGGSGPRYLNASLTYAFTTSGSYAITATYSGDTNYSPSGAPAQNITVMYPMPNVVVTPYSQTVSYGGTATITALIDTTNKSTYPSGTVTFRDGAQFGPILAGPTTCTNATDASGNFACQAVGTFTVTSGDAIFVNYSGDANYPGSYTWAAISMPDFAFSASGGVQVTAGQSQTLTVTFISFNGLSGTVSNLGCSALPAETTCTFNPTQVTLPSNGNVSTTLTVTTAALGQSRRAFGFKDTRARNWGISETIILLGACLIGVPLSRRRRHIPVAIMTVLLIFFTSCGGGNGGGGGGAQNPVPSITSLSPTKIAAGSQVQSLYINGPNFMSSSTVTYNGALHNSSLQSPTQLQIALGPGDVAATGQYPVVVTNPPPGGGSSAPVNFDIVTGTPTGFFSANLNATIGPIAHTATLSMQIQ